MASILTVLTAVLSLLAMGLAVGFPVAVLFFAYRGMATGAPAGRTGPDSLAPSGKAA